MTLGISAGCKTTESQPNSDLEQAHVRRLTPSIALVESSAVSALAATASSSAFPRSATLAPIASTEWLIRLGTDSQVVDFVTAPLGATEPRPLVIAIHGAGDRPNWACGGWRIGMENFAFTLCPMGQPMGGARYAWRNAGDIEAAIDRARLELNQRFKDYLAQSPAIYAGFSQGATLARSILVKRAREFPMAALAEGGYAFLLDAHFASQYRAAGGRKLLLLCGTSGCLVEMTRAKKSLLAAGLDVRVVGTPTAGHNLNREMQCVLRRAWSGFVATEAGWQSFDTHRWPSASSTHGLSGNTGQDDGC